MPPIYFALLLLGVLFAAALTVWAIASFGMSGLALPGIMIAAMALRVALK